MRVEIQRVEGRVNLVTGDGLRAVFGAPIAHEDHAVRALHAALGLQQAFAAFAEDLRRTQGIILTLRVGLHAGPVVVGAIGSAGHTDDTALGFTGELADGLQQFAGEDAIYVSEAVRRHAEGFFRFKALGECALPDIARPVRVYECTGANQVHTRREAFLRRHLSAFRGREREIDLLKTLWMRAYGGQGQVVCLFGEAGIGKSRLLADLLERANARGVASLAGAGDAIERATPYHAWRPVFADLMGLVGIDDVEERRRRVLARVQADPTLARLAPLLNSVLPLDLPDNELTAQLTGEMRADNTRELLVQLLQPTAATPAARAAPLLIVLDDAHWLDSASWALTRLVVARIRPLLLVLATRPLVEPLPDDYRRLRQNPFTEHLRLEPLSPRDTLALVCDRLGVR
ncbi:MAG: AAA family ATPase, partial [Acidimicrobiales bacterium]